MPAEFLTAEQAYSYGTFKEVQTRPELERFFFLDDHDRNLIVLRRADSHRLQLCSCARCAIWGLFLLKPWEVRADPALPTELAALLVVPEGHPVFASGTRRP